MMEHHALYPRPHRAAHPDPATQVGAATRTDYLYGVNRLASLNGSVKTWYAADTLGSVRQTLDDAGVPMGSANYDPWGGIETSTVGMFGFTSSLLIS